VEALEGLHADRISENTERLAHHAVQADLRAKAVHYLRRAGLKAAARSALPEARAFLDNALELLQGLPEARTELEQAVDIRLDLRPILAASGESRLVLKRLSEAEILAQRLADEGRRGRALALMTDVHTSLGELDEALVTGSRALDIARRIGDSQLRILATTQLENAHWERGDYERGVELATANLALLPPDAIGPEALSASFGRPAAIYDRYYLALNLSWLGRFREAAEQAADAIRLAESTRHPGGTVSAYFGAGVVRIVKGDFVEARPLYEHTIAVATNTGVVMGLPTMVATLAWTLAELGETGEAQRRAQEAKGLLDMNIARGSMMQRPVVYRFLGRVNLLVGRLVEAQRLAEWAIECSPHQLGWAAIAWHLLADVVSHPDRFDAERSETYYRQALGLAQPRSMRPLVAHCHLGLGKLYRRTDKREQADEHLATATTMYREMGMTYWLEKAEAEMR
jgi:tetratricopeptide (TPR) repeat protein